MERWLRVAFAASLLVNVFAAGAIGGGLVMLSRQGSWHPRAGLPPRPIRAAGDGLPLLDRARFRHAMRQVIDQNRDLLRLGRESRRAAGELFVQPQFDQAAVAAALERARGADSELRKRLELAAVQFGATLPADERQSLAQGLERGGPLRRPPGKGGAGPAAP